MSQLKALTKLGLGGNKLPLTEGEFIIESFPQLTELGLQDLGLTGEHLRSTNCASDPADIVACSCARVDWRASGAQGALSQWQQLERYVLLCIVPMVR